MVAPASVTIDLGWVASSGALPVAVAAAPSPVITQEASTPSTAPTHDKAFGLRTIVLSTGVLVLAIVFLEDSNTREDLGSMTVGAPAAVATFGGSNESFIDDQGLAEPALDGASMVSFVGAIMFAVAAIPRPSA